MKRLEGKVAIITGAARGTGAATARIFVEEGARVVLGDLRDELGEAVAKELAPAARYVFCRWQVVVRSLKNWRRLVIYLLDDS